MPVRVYAHPACRDHAAPGHLERPARLDAAERGLRESGLDVAWQQATPLGEEALARVHTTEHVERVRRACAASAILDPDTYAKPASWPAALAAAGAAVDAARHGGAIALPRPPGHHATRTRPMGFCLFNNVALAADALAREGRRVAIVDLDVHHGNGTQDVFWERDDVLFVSLHGWPLYPGTGAVEELGGGPGRGFTLNLPLPAGTGTAGYLEVFDAAVVPKVERFAPDAILVSLGLDADHRDPIGNLLLGPQAYHACIRRLDQLGPHLAIVLEGGYDLDAVREGVRAAAAALAGEPCPDFAPPPEGARPLATLRERLRRAHPDLP